MNNSSLGMYLRTNNGLIKFVSFVQIKLAMRTIIKRISSGPEIPLLPHGIFHSETSVCNL